MTQEKIPQSLENRKIILKILNVIHEEWEMLSMDSGTVQIRIPFDAFSPLAYSKIQSVLDRLRTSGLIFSHEYERKVFGIICNGDFEKRYAAYVNELDVPEEGRVQLSEVSVPELFKIRLNDREISVNGYSLSEPFWESKNFQFFEYLLDHSDMNTRKDTLPASLQKALGSKQLNVLIGELGFKDEMADAFFPQPRTKSSIFFRKEVSAKQLTDEGIDTVLLVKALDLAHARRTKK